MTSKKIKINKQTSMDIIIEKLKLIKYRLNIEINLPDFMLNFWSFSISFNKWLSKPLVRYQAHSRPLFREPHRSRSLRYQQIRMRRKMHQRSRMPFGLLWQGWTEMQTQPKHESYEPNRIPQRFQQRLCWKYVLVR